ncbi:MAG: carboxypeptidase-like regulatory domain-containing protein [Lewinellaceae bacterium]|nr:carboxypeptidase-like regulatory domain-containing protein [Lewinellaceae bacterium]
MKHSLLLVVFFAMLNNAAAQLNLRGKVTDLNGEPLPGATIFERGTLKNTTTSMEGTYSLQYSHPEAVIVFVYSGFVTQEIVTNGRIEIDVFMEPEILEVSPIVIVGTRRDNRTQTETLYLWIL